MNETIQAILAIYGVAAAVLLGLGILYFVDSYNPSPTRDPQSFHAKRARIGARLIVLALVWPLVVPLLLTRSLIFWVPRIWREAWS